jgi:hypothetical protein
MYRFKWALLWTVLIFVLYAIPGKDLPHFDWADLISLDKFVHAGIFFMHFLFLAGIFLAGSNDTFKNALFIALASSLYGALLELMQLLVFEGRSFEWLDILANDTGIILALFTRKKWINHPIFGKIFRP